MNKHLLSLACGLVAAILPAQETKPKADTGKLRAEAEAAFQHKDYAAAAAAYRKVVDADDKDGEAWFRMGFSLHSTDKLDEALVAHEKAATFKDKQFVGVAAYNAACVYSLKGNKDKAFEWLDKAAALGFDQADHMATDTDMDALRKDARYEKAVAKVKAATSPRGAGGFQAYVPPPAVRKSVRIALFGQNSSPGQVAIDFGPTLWKDSYEAKSSSPEFQNKKWRFGQDFWTNLDTSIDLDLGGVAVPAGYYYLTLEKRGEDFLLALHDAAATRKLKLDGAVAHMLKGGIEVKMEHGTGEVAKELEIALKLDQGSKDTGALLVRFGPHTLKAPLKLKLQ